MEKLLTIKFLSSGDTQNFPDITTETFLQNFNNRSGLMNYKDEQYWKIVNDSMFLTRKLTYYYKENKDKTNLIVSYDLDKLIDYKID